MLDQQETTAFRHRYTGADIAADEIDRIFSRMWLYAVPSSDVAAAGEWATFEIGPESVIIVRTQNGELAAHHNVCQHRGRRLVEGRRGTAAAFRCPYHAWSYQLDGSLRSVHEPTFFEEPVDPTTCRLPEVQVGEWGGLVWICLDPAAGPVEEYLAPLPEHLAAYHLDEFQIVRDQTVEWNCNWKIAVDAFHETYHNLATHPQLMPISGDTDARITCYDRHSRFILRSGVPAPSYRRRERPTDAQVAMFATYGFDASEFAGTADDVLTHFQEHRREAIRAQGHDIEGLTLEQFTENYHYTVFPNTQISVYPDRTLITRSRPHPNGRTDEMIFDLQSFSRHRPGAAPDRAVTETGHGVDFPLVPDFVRQDAANVIQVQRGMSSSGYQGPRLSKLEDRIAHWHRTYDRVMDGTL